MSLIQKKTDNSFLKYKVDLRIDQLPKKKTVTVLDAYCGEGMIWQTIKKALPAVRFNIVAIDKRNTPGVHLVGDNRKYLKAMDLMRFDVIDLDAWGIPFDQLNIVLSRPTKKGAVVHVTFIQSVTGILPMALLESLGYPRDMVRKCPTLFGRDGFGKFKNYLAVKGIKEIVYYQHHRKSYICFKI